MDGSWDLDFEEFNSDVCIDIQHFLFGGHLDQETFDEIDTDGNGAVDGHEAAAAIEEYHDHGDDKPEDGKPEDGKPEDGKPKDGKPEDGKPEDGKPEDGKPEDDMMKLNIIFCACDEDGSGALSHEELSTEVCKIIVQHETSEEDFAAVDADGDGEITQQEVIDFFNNMKPDTKRKLRSMQFDRENFFSDDAKVEAMVRVLGCGCDMDGSYDLNFEEFNSKVCL